MQLFGEIARPNRAEHLLRYLAVQPAHAVRLLAGVEGKDRHGELLALVIRIGTTHTDQVIPLDAEFAGIIAHVLVEQVLVEIIVTCGNRCMAGVESARAYHFLRLVEGQTLFLNEVYETLETHEGSVSLVAMINILLDA